MHDPCVTICSLSVHTYVVPPTHAVSPQTRLRRSPLFETAHVHVLVDEVHDRIATYEATSTSVALRAVTRRSLANPPRTRTRTAGARAVSLAPTCVILPRAPSCKGA